MMLYPILSKDQHLLSVPLVGTAHSGRPYSAPFALSCARAYLGLCNNSATMQTLSVGAVYSCSTNVQGIEPHSDPSPLSLWLRSMTFRPLLEILRYPVITVNKE